MYGYPETAVVVSVRFDSKPINVMLDTGAQPSVVDRLTAERMNLPYVVREHKVYGIGKSPIRICGTLEVGIDIGSGKEIRHKLEVLDTSVRTAILGRSFLANFKEVCFDMKGFRVRLGDGWLDTGFSIHGGQPLARAECMQITDSKDTKFDVNPALPWRQREAIHDILAKHSEVFATNHRRPKEIRTAEHRITLLDDRPIKHRPLRVSPDTEAEIGRQIDEMSRNGIIRTSESPWGSRIILVRKKDGTQRFAGDYRCLNAATKKDVFDRMEGSEVFSTLDGASAYWSIPVREEDREYTSFVSTRGQFEFNRMPFGLCNSQATYQRAVNDALREATNAESFVDDTIVHSSDFSSHLTHLEGVGVWSGLGSNSEPINASLHTGKFSSWDT